MRQVDYRRQPNSNSSRFMDRFRLFLQEKHYSYATEKTYCAWVVRFIRFHGIQGESEFTIDKLEQFLTYIANERQLRVNSQKTVLNSLVCLYRDFLGINTAGLNYHGAKAPKKVPVVINIKEAKGLFIQLGGVYRTVAKLMYGSGLRLSEVIKLRVCDLDLTEKILRVAHGKGNKQRYVPIPNSLLAALRSQLDFVANLHREDIEDGNGYVALTESDFRGSKSESRMFSDQFVFPAIDKLFDERTGTYRRHYISEQNVRRQIQMAAQKANIPKNITCHTLRHSYATALLKQGTDLRSIQTLLGHDSVKTTEIYTHVIDTDFKDIISPADLITDVANH